MNISPETPTVVAKIAGVEGITIATPFAVGHVLTEGEAAALNQTLRENIGNQLRKTVTDGVLGADGKPQNPVVPFSVEAVQALVDAKVAEYEFGVRTGSTREASDPIGAEAKKIIRDLVKDRLKQAGKSLTKEQMTTQIAAIYDKDPAKWRAAADAALAARQKALKGQSLDGLSF